MQTTNERAKLSRSVMFAATRELIRKAFHGFNRAKHPLGRAGVMVRTVVRAVFDARNRTDGDPEQINSRVRERIDVCAVVTYQLFHHLQLLPPRRRVSIALDDSSRRIGEVIRVPTQVSVPVPSFKVLQLDLLSSPLVERGKLLILHWLCRLARGRFASRRRWLWLWFNRANLLNRCGLFLHPSHRTANVQDNVSRTVILEPHLAILRAHETHYRLDVAASFGEIERNRLRPISRVIEPALARLPIRRSRPTRHAFQRIKRRSPIPTGVLLHAPVQQQIPRVAPSAFHSVHAQRQRAVAHRVRQPRPRSIIRGETHRRPHQSIVFAAFHRLWRRTSVTSVTIRAFARRFLETF